jgi:tryptophanyl-tRNA synthetase
MGYREFKELVAQSVKDFLSDFQNKLQSVDDQAITRKLEADEASMNQIASATLLKVQKAVGLRP